MSAVSSGPASSPGRRGALRLPFCNCREETTVNGVERAVYGLEVGRREVGRLEVGRPEVGQAEAGRCEEGAAMGVPAAGRDQGRGSGEGSPFGTPDGTTVGGS